MANKIHLVRLWRSTKFAIVIIVIVIYWANKIEPLQLYKCKIT